MIKEDFLKRRSIQGCLKSTIQTLTLNFATIFRHTYIPALAYAIASAALILTQTISAMHGQIGGTPVSQVIMLVCILLVLGTQAWLQGNAISLVNDNGLKKNRNRCLLFTVFQLVYYLVLVLLVSAAAVALVMVLSQKQMAPATISAINITVALGLTLIALLLFLPFCFSGMRYLNAEGTVRLSAVFRGYGTGLRHYGYLLGVILLAGFIYAMVSFVLSLPLIIVYSATMFNAFGIMGGDPSGLPNGFPWIVALAALLSSFLLALASLWMFYNIFFAYTSIEVMEKEKQQLKAQ